MKLTNDLGLPEPIVRAICNDGYSKGDCDYSVTTLIKPVRIVSLSRKYQEHLVEDAADRIFSLFGRSIHTVLELAASDRYLVEKRFYGEFAGKRIGGQIDVWDKEMAILSDYKLCSRFVTGDGVKPEWTAQCSINALLMRRKGHLVKGAQIVAIFRDWSKMMANRKDDYPQKQVQILPVPLWDDAKTEQYVLDRIAAHEAARENPPVCTPEERWSRPTKWALMKKGQKRAVKLYDSPEEADTAFGNGAGVETHFVEERPGEETRCLFYCPVNKYCSFYRDLVQQ